AVEHSLECLAILLGSEARDHLVSANEALDAQAALVRGATPEAAVVRGELVLKAARRIHASRVPRSAARCERTAGPLAKPPFLRGSPPAEFLDTKHPSDKRLGTRRDRRQTASIRVPAWERAPPNSLQFTSTGRASRERRERRSLNRIGVLGTRVAGLGEGSSWKPSAA